MTPTTSGPSRTTVVFSQRQWASRDSCLTLALTATAQLVWPSCASSSSAAAAASSASASASASSPSSVFSASTVPAARVAQLVRAGRLWIGHDGRRVQLGVQATLSGGKKRRVLEREQLAQLHALVAGWAWGELGLVVHRSDNGGGSHDDTLALSHPPSANGLYAPSGIARARLERVNCQLRFCCCPAGLDLPTVVLPPGRVGARAGARARARAKARARRPKKKPPVQTSTDPGCLFDDHGWARTRALVEAALATFVGTHGRQVGARALDRQSLPGGAPSLLDVAPAVWSHHLFKAAAARAAHVPLIHRALSAFTNAQSPSLRRKAEALTRASPAADAASTDRGGLLPMLEEVLLKHILFAPQRIKRPARRPAARSASPLLAMPATSRPEQAPTPAPTPAREELDDTDECTFYDLDMASLDDAFDLSQQSTDDDACSGDVDEDEDGSEAGEAVDWDDIEAWTEYGYEYEDEYECGYETAWPDDGDEDEQADWLDVHDEQLEVMLSTADWCEDDQYMQIDETDLMTLGIADEGISMWRNEYDMIEQML